MKKNIGFIGLGIMGKPMAENLLKAGYPLTVYNRTMEKAKELEKSGANIASSPAELAKEASIIITIVSDTQAVEEVIVGHNGVLRNCKPETVIIDMSTISPTTTRCLHVVLKNKRIHLLDAPVTGGKKGAIEGTLTIMVGGDRDIFEENKEIFQAMGKKIFYVGESGMGQYMKLVNNLIACINLQGIIEGLILGKKAGLDPWLMLEVLTEGSAKSVILEGKGRDILKRDFSPRFYLKLAAKDLRLAKEAADELGLPAPLTNLAHTILKMAEVSGKGDLDFGGLATFWEDMLNMKISK